MGWLDKFFGKKTDAGNGAVTISSSVTHNPSNDLSDYSPHDEARDYIRRDYLGGSYSDAEVIGNARDIMLDEMDETELDRVLPVLLAEVKAEHFAAQKDWPEKTDCDRLDEIFAALEAGGIIARQNFTCCGTCGSAEIRDEMDEVRKNGGPVRGYAFFHMQDAEAAVDGQGLYLNYGATEEGETAALMIAKDIVAQFESHGLKTNWNGRWEQRIGIELDWKKRR